MRIDCHTHIISEEIRREYFDRTDGWALVMQMPESLMSNPDTVATVTGDERLFLCPSIDLKAPLKPQLDVIEPNIEKWRVVGLKIYLSYQTGRADDPLLYPVYEFCRKHRLSVTIHSGYVSLVLPSDNDFEGTNALNTEKAARQYPDVNFIIAHMDDPRYDQCIDIVMRNDNMFTDFSGAYEPGTKEGGDIEGAIDMFGHAILRYPDSYKKILYGTDFCPPINLSAIDEYFYTIDSIFKDSSCHEDVYLNNALRAFPRLNDYYNNKEK